MTRGVGCRALRTCRSVVNGSSRHDEALVGVGDSRIRPVNWDSAVDRYLLSSFERRKTESAARHRAALRGEGIRPFVQAMITGKSWR